MCFHQPQRHNFHISVFADNKRGSIKKQQTLNEIQKCPEKCSSEEKRGFVIKILSKGFNIFTAEKNLYLQLNTHTVKSLRIEVN